MKYFIAYFAFYTLLAQAQICDDNSKLGALAEFAEGKCFNEEVSPEDIEVFGSTKGELSTICKNCENIPLQKIMENDSAKAETRSAYGKAVLNEFQKELSLLTIDLMRVRSSYGLDFNSKKVAASCDIVSQLKKPTCLSANDFKSLVSPVKNSLATELAQFFSNTPSQNGLFTKRANSCGIKDSDALFSHMRFAESLLTPNLINKLKVLNLKNGTNLDSELKTKNVSAEVLQNLDLLSNHPIFNSLLDDTTSLNAFLADASKIKSSGKPEEDNSAIIDLLFHKNNGNAFAKKTESRCEKILSKTSSNLEEVYCGKVDTIADDLVSMQSISANSFKNMPARKAENELQTHCSLLNSNQGKKYRSFAKVLEDIHGTDKNNLIKAPLNEFKEMSYTFMFQNVAENICVAQKLAPPCSADSKDQKCLLLKYYNLSKSSKLHQQMASQSDDNINLILRSLVGDGLPQKDGKVDQAAVAVLQKERILSGGSSEAPQKKATASEFHQAVRKTSSMTSLAGKTPVPAPEIKEGQVPTQFSSNTSAVAPESATSEGQSNSNEIKHTQKSKKPSTFSALSDQEQQDILNRLKRSSKKSGSTQAIDEDGEGSALGEGAEAQVGPTTFTAKSDGVNQNNDSRFVNPKLANNFGGKKAVLDPIKKVNAVNNALIDANVNRSPASTSSASSAPTLSVSKPSKVESEIKIQASEQELSKVSEFKEKLKALLAAHSQDISVVEDGEKIVVKLNDYKIDVKYNHQKGVYEVVPVGQKVPEEYINTISYYFNVTLKSRTSRNQLMDALPKTKKN